ncbi:MAG: SUF system Fe-S cluster assembly regulator [Deltaproteobacteria bacterium]|nr:SUF system Fe-S cluster assembly regulator [Deltaproteobacteria bacterium]
MIRITKQTDYGIVLLTHLASAPDGLRTAPELAAEARLPLPMVSKILKALTRSGLLDSHRGAKGGYSMTRPAEGVSVAEVITSIEGPIGITECIDDVPGECGYAATCGVRSNWNRINLAIREALEQISLAEMGPVSSKSLVSLGGARDQDGQQPGGTEATQ